MIPPKDTVSDPLANDYDSYRKFSTRLTHPAVKGGLAAGLLLGLVTPWLTRESLSTPLQLLGFSLILMSGFGSFAWARWKILRDWPKDHPWREWAIPGLAVFLPIALLASILPVRFVMATISAPFKTRADVILEYDARYDVAAELISLYGPEVEQVIPEGGDRSRTRVRLRLGKATSRSGMLGDIIIKKDYGNEFMWILRKGLAGRDDYPSQAIIEWEGVYREAAGQCVFPLHKPVPEDYRQYLSEALGVQFGEVEGQLVVFGKGWISWSDNEEGAPCYSLSHDYGSNTYAIWAALSYPLLYFRSDLYTFRTERRRYYDFSWSALKGKWKQLM